MKWFLACLFLAISYSAASACTPNGDMVAKVKRELRVLLTEHGITDGGTLIEVFSNTEGRFAVVETLPNGCAFVRVTGIGWAQFKIVPAGVDS